MDLDCRNSRTIEQHVNALVSRFGVDRIWAVAREVTPERRPTSTESQERYQRARNILIEVHTH